MSGPNAAAPNSARREMSGINRFELIYDIFAATLIARAGPVSSNIEVYNQPPMESHRFQYAMTTAKVDTPTRAKFPARTMADALLVVTAVLAELTSVRKPSVFNAEVVHFRGKTHNCTSALTYAVTPPSTRWPWPPP